MLKKIAVFTVTAVLSSFFLSFNAFALTAQDFIDGGQNLGNEISQVKSCLQAESSSLPVSGSPNYDAAYKVYRFIGSDILTACSSKTTIQSAISDEYTWKIPTSSGDLITVGKDAKTGGWKVLGAALYSQNPSAQSAVVNKTSLNAVVQSRTSQISDLKYVESPRHYTTFAYVVAGETEYLIPYSVQSDMTGLENGKMYTAAEAMEILDTNIAELNMDTDGNANAGIGGIHSTLEEDPHTFPYLWISLSIIGGVAVLGIIISGILRRKKVSK